MPDINIPQPTVYSQPGCVQCRAVKRFLDDKKIPYQEIDLTENEGALDLVKNQWGYRGVPVVSYNFEHFQGFNPDELGKIVESYSVVETAVA